MPQIADLDDDLPLGTGEPMLGFPQGKPSPAGGQVPMLPGAEDDDLDDELDETLAERLFALTEMFPESVQTGTSKMVHGSLSAASWLYSTSRTVLWVLASSGIILALPVMFEHERSQIEEMKLAEQRQLLLGPNAAMSGAGGFPGMPSPPAAR